RLGIIGVGGRGSSLVRDLLAVENVEVKAICDLVPEKVARAQKAVTDVGQPQPAGFSKGEWDFKNLTQLDLDIVYVATPWNWHVPMAVSAMKNGKHGAFSQQMKARDCGDGFRTCNGMETYIQHMDWVPSRITSIFIVETGSTTWFPSVPRRRRSANM